MLPLSGGGRGSAGGGRERAGEREKKGASSATAGASRLRAAISVMSLKRALSSGNSKSATEAAAVAVAGLGRTSGRAA